MDSKTAAQLAAAFGLGAAATVMITRMLQPRLTVDTEADGAETHVHAFNATASRAGAESAVPSHSQSQQALDSLSIDVGGIHNGPIIIGVAGASGSGKTSLGGLLAARLRAAHVSACVLDISCDSYYKGLPPGQDAAEYNWDHPSALDWDLLVEQLAAIREGKRVEVPSYSFVHHRRLGDSTPVDGSATDVILLDGIFVLVDPRIRELLDIAVFCSEDPDVCLVRRLRRDLVERGRSIDSVLKQYLKFVRPGFQAFVAPTMQFADLIIPRAKENSTAIALLARECARKIIHRQRQAARGTEGHTGTDSTAQGAEQANGSEEARAPSPEWNMASPRTPRQTGESLASVTPYAFATKR